MNNNAKCETYQEKNVWTITNHILGIKCIQIIEFRKRMMRWYLYIIIIMIVIIDRKRSFWYWMCRVAHIKTQKQDPKFAKVSQNLINVFFPRCLHSNSIFRQLNHAYFIIGCVEGFIVSGLWAVGCHSAHRYFTVWKSGIENNICGFLIL